MTVKAIVPFPQEFLEQVDRRAREEGCGQRELMLKGMRLYMEMHRRERRPTDDPRVRLAVRTQDALARLSPGIGEDSAIDLRRWREAR
jgi:hypothetical protein